MTVGRILAASFRRRTESFSALVAVLTANSFVLIVFLSVVFAKDTSALVTNEGFRNFFTLCALVMFIFSTVFARLIALYLMEDRRREFATWLLLGMRRWTAFALIAGEIIIAFAIAQVLALPLAATLNRFFALLLGYLMREGRAVEMAVSGKVIGVSLMIFAIQAALISLSILKFIYGLSAKELFSRGDGRAGRSSLAWMRGVVGAALIVLGYVCAVFSDDRSVFFAIIPTLLLVITGTFLFMGGLVPLFASVRRRSMLQDASALIAFSGSFRHISRDIRILSLTAILIAASATAGGALFAVASNAEVEALRSCPNGAELSGLEGRDFDSAVERIDTVFAASSVGAPTRLTVRSLPVRISVGQRLRPNAVDADVISRSDWASLMVASGRTVLPMETEDDFFLCADVVSTVFGFSAGATIDIRSLALGVTGRLGIVRAGYALGALDAAPLLVVSDDVWNRLAAYPATASIGRIAVWNAPKGEPYDFGPGLRSALGDVSGARILIQSEERTVFTRKHGAMRFTGVFLAAIFLFAAIATMALKFYEDARNDRDRYRLLSTIGMRSSVAKRVLAIQILYAYVPPLVLALMHTAFAIKMLGTLTRFEVALPAVRVALVTSTLFSLSSIGIARRYRDVTAIF